MSQDDVERVACDRVETVINRCENMGWVTVYDRAPLAATLRLALDTEVEAGGPYLNNGHNRRAALSAMPQRLSPDLIAQLKKLASRLTAQGEYEACDLIDTVVARVSAMPGRELLAEALEALDGVIRVADRKTVEFDAARAAADKIRASLTQEKQT